MKIKPIKIAVFKYRGTRWVHGLCIRVGCVHCSISRANIDCKNRFGLIVMMAQEGRSECADTIHNVYI